MNHRVAAALVLTSFGVAAMSEQQMHEELIAQGWSESQAAELVEIQVELEKEKKE